MITIQKDWQEAMGRAEIVGGRLVPSAPILHEDPDPYECCPANLKRAAAETRVAGCP